MRSSVATTYQLGFLRRAASVTCHGERRLPRTPRTGSSYGPAAEARPRCRACRRPTRGRPSSRALPHAIAPLFLCTLPVVIYVVVHSPGNAAACFTQVAICASSRSSSWMSIQRASLPVPPGGTGRSDEPRKKATLT